MEAPVCTIKVVKVAQCLQSMNGENKKTKNTQAKPVSTSSQRLRHGCVNCHSSSGRTAP